MYRQILTATLASAAVFILLTALTVADHASPSSSTGAPQPAQFPEQSETISGTLRLVGESRPAAPADSVIIYTTDAAWHTGRVYEDQTCADGYIRVRDDNALGRGEVGGYARFDTSGIPDEASIISVTLDFYVSDFDGEGPSVDFNEVEHDPVYASCGQRWNDITDGTTYLNKGYVWDTGWWTADLGSAGAQDLRDLLTQDWFAVGFDHDGASARWAYIYGHSSAYCPHLVVAYESGGSYPPSIDLVEPSSDVTVDTGGNIAIEWTDTDPDDNAYISLARDTDSDPTNGTGHTWLVEDLREDPDGSGDQYVWDTAGVPQGTYYVWAMIYDGLHLAAYSVAPGRVVIEQHDGVGPLVYHNHTIDDDAQGGSDGNGDGVVNCGETIEMPVALYNQGTDTATGVEGFLSYMTVRDSYVSFNDTQENYPDIPGGAVRTCEYDFDFEIHPNTPDGYVQHFDLEITASNGGPWVDAIDIPIECPCWADLSGNGVVDVMDIALVADHWREYPNVPYDPNQDGFVTVVDIMMVAAEWGTCP